MGKEVQIYFPEVGEQLDTPPPKKEPSRRVSGGGKGRVFGH